MSEDSMGHEIEQNEIAESAGDDLSNLDSYGEPQQAAMPIPDELEFQCAQKGRDYQLFIRNVTSLEDWLAINAWVADVVPESDWTLQRRQYEDTNNKIALTSEDGDECPILFPVVLVFQMGRSSGQQRRDSGVSFVAHNFEDWLFIVNKMAKTPLAAWIRERNGTPAQRTHAAPDEPSAPPQPATVTGVTSSSGQGYQEGQSVNVPIRKITYVAETGRSGDIQNVLAFWHTSTKKQYPELRITNTEQIEAIGNMAGIQFALGTSYDGPFTVTCLLDNLRDGKSGKYPGDFWRTVTAVRRD